MSIKKTITVFITIIISSFFSFSTTNVAIMSGDWSESTIWSAGVPGCYDSLVIPAGIQVDITSTVDLEACPDSMVIVIYGRLEFQNGKKLKLPCNSDIMVHSGGSVGVGSGGGSSTYIEMCSSQYWNASSGDLTGPDQLCDGGCPPLSPLPITLLTFEAKMVDNENAVDLFWITASEIDNDYFTVERSTDGINWEFVCQQDGALNSSHEISYYDQDRKPLPGLTYYRLKQTDVNGEFSYSQIVSVRKSSDDITVYPNPVNTGNDIVVKTNEEINTGSITIYTAEGKIVRIIDVSRINTQTFFISTTGLQKGMYLLKIDDENRRIIVK